MSDTHPNAFRAEAEQKRKDAAQLANAANALDQQANELEGINSSVPVPLDLETNLPVGGTTYDPEPENKEDNKKTGKIFNKK